MENTIQPVVDLKKAEKREKILVMSLLAVAMFSQMFLYSVVASNASFEGQQYALRDYLAPSQIISPKFDQQLTDFSQLLRLSIVIATVRIQSSSLAFLGLDHSSVAQTQYTSFASAANSDKQPQVLGAYKVSPAYAP